MLHQKLISFFTVALLYWSQWITYAHGHEHEDQEAKVSDVVKVLAVCLFGFLILNFTLLYLVNIRDENVRRYMYNMISATISIFCAVMLNQAVNSFFLKQILVSPWPRGLNLKLDLKEKLIVYLLIFYLWFIMVNVLCFKLRDGPRSEVQRNLYAVSTIGGHLIAFAGIAMFGELQQSDGARTSLTMCFVVLICAAVFLWLCRLSSAAIRQCIARRVEEAEHGRELRMVQEEEEEEPAWEESTAEAEDEAAVLILSYLQCQCVAFTLFGRLPNIEREYEEYGEGEVYLMLLAALIWLILLFPATTIRTGNRARGWMKRIIHGAQNFVSLSFCWCIQTLSEWQFLLWLGDPKLSAVITAFAVTASSIFMILVLDKLADILQADEASQASRPSSSSFGNTPLKQSTSRQVVRFVSSTYRRMLTGVDVYSLRDWRSWEKALRTIITGFGLLVGLSWDKAFDVAELGIVHGFQGTVFTRRPVISRVVLGVAIVTFVLPAWLWYIVPSALMDDAAWAEKIEKERLETLRGEETTDTEFEASE